MLKIGIMRKCILLIVLLSVSFCLSKAHQSIESMPQDSFKVFKKKLNLNMDRMLDNLEDLQIDTNKFSELGNLNIDLNVDSIRMLAQLSAEGAIEELERSKTIAKRGAKTYMYSFDTKDTRQKVMGARTRVENKTFTNISEVEFFHKYGNIIVRESNSKQVELEIQYLDKDNTNASSNVSVVGKVLTITTNGGGKNRLSSKINYIISVPRHVNLNVDLDYGNIKADQLSGLLTANLSYSEMSLQKANNLSLKARYSDVKIGEVSNADLSGSYADIKIGKANKITTSGNYNDYRFDEVQHLSIGKSTSYGDCKIGTLGSMEGSIMYTDIDVNTLLSDINITSLYGDVMLRNVSPKARNINIKGSYCDITIGISPGFSSRFDAVLNYGDLTISKKYTVKYTESTEKSSRVVKRGQIGTGNPTTNIVVSNNYADIDIR